MKAKEYWIKEIGNPDIGYMLEARKHQARDAIQVIEYSAYESVCKERDSYKLELEGLEKMYLKMLETKGHLLKIIEKQMTNLQGSANQEKDDQ